MVSVGDSFKNYVHTNNHRFVKPIMESKDNSWRDATAEFALKVSNVDLLSEGFK